MSTEVICTIITAVASIIVAAIGINTAKQNKRTEEANKRAEEHAKLRQQESLLSLRMMDATLQLSVVTSNALTGGHNNGNVERAREAAKKAADDYEEFMRKITAHEVSQ